MVANMTNERTLFEEVWECRLPKRQTLEADLFTLQGLAPDRLEELNSLFKKAVTDCLANLLDENEASALVILMGEANFETPQKAYETLDSILQGGSQILKSAIVEEFRASVHLLLKKEEVTLASASGILSTFEIARPLAPTTT